MRARPTSEGLAAGLLTIALMVVALVSGNNLLYLVVGGLVSLWVMELIWGTWNLRGVDAVRRLPDEICADTDAVGRLVVRNRRRWLPVVDVRVLDDGTPAETRVPEIPPGSTAGGWPCGVSDGAGWFRCARCS